MLCFQGFEIGTTTNLAVEYRSHGFVEIYFLHVHPFFCAEEIKEVLEFFIFAEECIEYILHYLVFLLELPQDRLKEVFRDHAVVDGVVLLVRVEFVVFDERMVGIMDEEKTGEKECIDHSLVEDVIVDLLVPAQLHHIVIFDVVPHQEIAAIYYFLTESLFVGSSVNNPSIFIDGSDVMYSVGFLSTYLQIEIYNRHKRAG